MEKQNSPGKMQPKSVWEKAYWNFNDSDWQYWIDSFKTFPIKYWEYHIKSVIDLFMPETIELNFI